MTPTIYAMFEGMTGTWQYIVVDTLTMTAAIVDPVLDYDPCSQELSDQAANSLIIFIKELGLKVDRILETHVPEDHISAASYLQRWLACDQGYIPPIYLGCHPREPGAPPTQQGQFPREEYRGSVWRTSTDEEEFNVGELKGTVIHLPGHSPHHVGYKIGDNVLCGDSILHPDIGTARCDLPGGDAQQQFESCQRLLGLPDHVRIWPGHDNLPGGRKPIAWMTVRDHKELNKHLRYGITKEGFTSLRNQADEMLTEPKILRQSSQAGLWPRRPPVPSTTGLHRLFLSLDIGV